MDSLQRFYKSKDWERFRRIVIQQRTDSDGFVRCAMCGEPILKPYDLIVHHKTELTAGNVNDVMVALNPDNVECVHFKCHNKAHDRWQGFTHRPKAVYLVWGAPLSGKTTWVRERAGRNDLIVDVDDIWQCVSNASRYDKPKALGGAVFAVRDTLYDVVRHRAGKWQDAYVVAGVPTAGERERLAQRVGADELIHIETDEAECMRRLSLRDMDDRDRRKWAGYISSWFQSYQH